MGIKAALDCMDLVSEDGEPKIKVGLLLEELWS